MKTTVLIAFTRYLTAYKQSIYLTKEIPVVAPYLLISINL